MKKKPQKKEKKIENFRNIKTLWGKIEFSRVIYVLCMSYQLVVSTTINYIKRKLVERGDFCWTELHCFECMFSSWEGLLFSSWDWLSMYKVYVCMTFYPRLNPDIVPIIRFWDSPNIVVTIYVCRMYSTFLHKLSKWQYVLVLPLFSILNFQIAR